MTSQLRPPNIVWVLTDDQGYGDLGCHGNPVLKTPNLDAFAAESVRLTDFHVGPTCAPTRASLLTGHYANSTGVWHTIGGRSLLRKHEWTLAAALREAGYRTGIFGKWHLGDAPPFRPNERGFDISVIHGGGGISQTPDYWGNDYFDDVYLVNGVPQRFNGYCTDVWFEQARAFIEANREQPFFCYIACNAPHSPFNVDARYVEPYAGRVPSPRDRFYGMIANIDENFGRLRRHLNELGLERDTILIFMTDNGSATGARLDADGFVVDGFNAGLRGLKGSPYDGGHRVPFFVRWPGGNLAHGRGMNRLAGSVDFMPTLLDLCGVTVPPERTFHGTSLAPLLRDPDAAWPERTLVTDSQRVARPVKWRQSAVMTDRWRLINGAELYDAGADRAQRRDVAGGHPEVVAELRRAYETWWRIVSEQFERDIPIEIGRTPETVLTAHDWRNDDCDCPWHHGHIRRGMQANGYWEIEVCEPGEYEIELRRWPREADHAVTEGLLGDDIEWRRESARDQDAWLYTGGVALPIAEAMVTLGGRSQRSEILAPSQPAEAQAHLQPSELRAQQSVAAGTAGVTFRLRLDPGPAQLQTRFAGADGFEVGAYYVYVRRCGDEPVAGWPSSS